jgi:hypothetical protein
VGKRFAYLHRGRALGASWHTGRKQNGSLAIGFASLLLGVSKIASDKPKLSRTGRKKRQYSDSQKAEYLAALDLNGGNVNGTAKQLGIPSKTLENWSLGKNQHPDVANMGGEKKEQLVDRMDKIVHQLLDVIPDKIPEANLTQLSTAYGIMYDKIRLERGQPTSITESSVDECFRRLLQLADAAKQRRLEVSNASGTGGNGPAHSEADSIVDTISQ